MNTNSEFSCVIKTKLAGLSLLYGAEVDALRKDSQPPWRVEYDETPTLKSFVEVKTTRILGKEIDGPRQNSFARSVLCLLTYVFKTKVKLFHIHLDIPL